MVLLRYREKGPFRVYEEAFSQAFSVSTKRPFLSGVVYAWSPARYPVPDAGHKLVFVVVNDFKNFNNLLFSSFQDFYTQAFFLRVHVFV